MQAKLTITLPKDLHQRAKAWAALKGTTLTEVLRKQIEEFAPDWEAIEEAEDIRLADEVESRIARGEESFRDWAEVEAELDELPD
jgi:predicted DNA-binding protein